MIHFSCDSCGKALRAPESLAGKRGRCARCGQVTVVPEDKAVVVEVKRTADPSPFRSTADYEVDRGVVAVQSGSVLINPETPEAQTPPEARRRQMFIGEPYDPLGDQMRDVKINIPTTLPLGIPQGYATRSSSALPSETIYWIIASSIVGGVIGFCIGLIAAKWVL